MRDAAHTHCVKVGLVNRCSRARAGSTFNSTPVCGVHSGRLELSGQMQKVDDSLYNTKSWHMAGKRGPGECIS
eukprot:362706-Chlamydomonas_euryale.AAC.5